MPRIRSDKVTRIAVAGILIVVTVAFGAVMLASGERGSGFSLTSSVPFAAGAMAALLVLLVFEVRPREQDSKKPAPFTCPACEKPLIEGSRLCPHCGRLLEHDLSLPMEGDRTDG